MQLRRSKSYPTNLTVAKVLHTRNSLSMKIHGFGVTATAYGKASQELIRMAAKLKHDSDPSKFGKPLPMELSYPAGHGGLSN